MKLSIIGVERNQFEDKKTGEIVSYCSISLLEPVEQSVDRYGFVVTRYTTKYDNFDKVLSLYKNNKSVDVEFEFVKKDSQGNYRKKIKKLDELVL